MEKVNDIRKKLYAIELEEQARFRVIDGQSEACANISNLASAFSSLSEIDEVLTGGDDLELMKGQIFDALKFYCSQLPVIE